MDPKADDSDVTKKVRLYYASCMDRNNTKQDLGATPLINILKKVTPPSKHIHVYT